MNPERSSFSADDRPATSAEIVETAKAWIRRRDAGLHGMAREELRAWLAADPRHAEAFARTDHDRTALDWPLHSGAIDDVLEGLHARAQQRRARRRTRSVIAAACAIIVTVGIVWRVNALRSPEGPAQRSTLIVLAPQQQLLPDGTRVDLKEGSEIATQFAGDTRFVILKRGTAHFTVHKDPLRPFIVQADGVAVRAVGTAFSVEMDAKEVTVVVTEGRISVDQNARGLSGTASPRDTASASLAFVDEGKSVVLPTQYSAEAGLPGVRALPEAELNQMLAWRTPRLEFTGTPLAEVVAMINQHNRQQFVLADRALEKLVLSGVLRADKVDALVEMLQSDFKLTAERRGDLIILRQGQK